MLLAQTQFTCIRHNPRHNVSGLTCELRSAGWLQQHCPALPLCRQCALHIVPLSAWSRYVFPVKAVYAKPFAADLLACFLRASCAHGADLRQPLQAQTSSRVRLRRGEIVENVTPPLPLDTPLLLVKPPIGLSTPEIFKALDLSRRSKADPKGVLQELTSNRVLSQDLCINDLEQPAFDRYTPLAVQ